MTDLISRKAAIEALGECPEAEYEEGWVSSPIGEYKGWLNAYHSILSTPSVPAVPLDKLCEWLEVHARTPIYNMQHTAEWWKEELEKWMEEQDAAD